MAFDEHMNAAMIGGPSIGQAARDGLAILRRRRWLALCVGMLGCAFVLVITLDRVALYQADASLVLELGPTTMNFSDPDSGRIDANASYTLLTTEAELLTRKQVLLQALRDSGALHEPPFLGRSDPAKLLHNRLKVTTTREMLMIGLALRDESKDRAQRILDAIIAAYQSRRAEMHLRSSHGSVEFLRDQAASARQRLDQAREAEQVFRTQHEIVATDPNLNQFTQQLEDLSHQQADLASRLSASHAKLRGIAEAEGEPDPARRLQRMLQLECVNGDVLVMEQQTELNQLLDKQATLSQRYLDRHPAMIEVDQQVRDKRAALGQAVAMTRATIDPADQQLTEQARDLDARIAQTQTALNAYRANLNQLIVLQEETAMRQNLFEDLLTRRGQEEISSHLQPSRVVQVDSADAASEPVNRMYALFALVAACAGMTTSVATVVVAELFDQRIRGVALIRALTRLPILGVVPHVDDCRPIGREGDASRPRALADAIRSLRAALRLAAGERGLPQVVAFVSPTAGCGRSTIAARLGVALAAAGQRVLIVDADFRRPSLHIQLGEPGARGLGRLLAGDDVPPAPTSYPRLHLMAAGERVGSPSDLLHGVQLKRAIATWRDYYDHIFIDTPAINEGIADCLSVCELSDSLLVVVREGGLTREALQTGVRHLQVLAERLIGVVVVAERGATPEVVVSYPADARIEVAESA